MTKLDEIEARLQDAADDEDNNWGCAAWNLTDPDAECPHCRLFACASGDIQYLVGMLRRTKSTLADLVATHERWNAGVQRVIGRPANWDDGYLDEARALLAELEE